MGTLYVRVGNRTMSAEEAKRLTPAQIEQAKLDAKRAEQKRLENIQKSLGVKGPQNVTLDVTPAGIAARKAAIAAEEAKLAEETRAATAEAVPAPEETTKKSKGKKAVAAA